MADGTSFSANVQTALAQVPTRRSADKCPHCDKQGLPVLLTIPTLADQPDGASGAAQATLAPLLKGIAEPALADACYALRTLREGYVMAYYETPPVTLAHEQGWTIARVHSGGYMTQTRFGVLGLGPVSHTPITASADDPFACSRTGSYASALLFVIPRPEQAGHVWVAFSSHPWSEGVRRRFAKSAALRRMSMTAIDAARGRCARSVPLTEANIRQSVIDFSPEFDLARIDGNPFPLRPLAATLDPHCANTSRPTFLRTPLAPVARPEDAPDVLAQAKIALGYSADNHVVNGAGLIVGLADPEGVTATAAQRRITRCNTAAEWITDLRDHQGQPDGYWRLQSALTVRGLLKRLDGLASDRKARHLRDARFNGQSVSRARFDTLMREDQLPADATFAPDMTRVYAPQIAQWVPTFDPHHGTIEFPDDAAVDSTMLARKQGITDKLTGKRSVKLPGGGRENADWAQFLDLYEQHVEEDRARLARIEQDHKAWLQSEQFRQLHTQHFDDAEPRDGVAYARCIDRCLRGGPLGTDALAWWQDFLSDDPHDKNNLLVRALLGNQVNFFDWFSQPEPVATTWDELKNLLDLGTHGYGQPGRNAAAEVRGLAQSLLVTATAVVAARDNAHSMSDRLRLRLEWLGQSLMGKAETGLILYQASLPMAEAGRLWRRMSSVPEIALPKRGEIGARQVKSLVLSGSTALDLAASPKDTGVRVAVYLWHHEEIDFGEWARAITADTWPLMPAALSPGSRRTALQLSEAQLEALARQSMKVITNASSGVLSAGSGFLQALVMGEAWHQIKTAGPEDRQAAALTLLSGGIGLSAAFMETGMSFARQLEKEGAALGLKVAAGYAAAFATAVDAFKSLISVFRYADRGDDSASLASLSQSAFFFIAAYAITAETTAAAVGVEFLGSATVAAMGLS